MPSSRSTNGKTSCGNTSTEAMRVDEEVEEFGRPADDHADRDLAGRDLAIVRRASPCVAARASPVEAMRVDQSWPCHIVLRHRCREHRSRCRQHVPCASWRCRQAPSNARHWTKRPMSRLARRGVDRGRMRTQRSSSEPAPSRSLASLVAAACSLPARAAATRCVLNPAGDVARAAARPDRRLDRADAADHRAGDGADRAVRLALPRIEQRRATYEPDWDHSTQLELVIWAAPLLIIIALGAITWISTHIARSLPPARPASTPAQAGRRRRQAARGRGRGARLEVAVHLSRARHRHRQRAGGAGRPRRSTSRSPRPSVMNSFFIPALAGQIYAMPGMETQAARRASTSPATTTASRPTTAAPASPTCTSSSTA